MQEIIRGGAARQRWEVFLKKHMDPTRLKGMSSLQHLGDTNTANEGPALM